MKPRRLESWGTWLSLLVLLVVPHGLAAQQDKAAALKQSLAANQKQQREYKWVETTVISLKGEEKSRVQKQCFYGPDGKVQKQQLTAPPQQSAPGGLKGKAAAKKKEEITAAMNQAVALIHSYVPPDPQRIQAAKGSGNLAIVPIGPNAIRIDIRNYQKSGDSLSLGLDTAGNALQTVSVKSYLDSQKNAVTLDVTFARLRGGLSYPANIALNVPEQKMLVVIQNSNYERLTPPPSGQAAAKPAAGQAAVKPAAASSAAGGTSTAAIDALTAPIALYPDPLVAQILPASTDFAAVQKFAGWLGSNASLKGTALQDGAEKAGFAPCYVALAPFPQVVKMLVEKPEWTKGLGKEFTTNRAGVFDSIQRLRAAAQALGNLKTTEQQEVVPQTTSSGQQVIVIQPANPQVIYVPVYTQTVYVQPAPPPSSVNVAGAAMVGFAAGVIIASSHNHYYSRWDAYDEAWDRREDYYEDRREYAEDRYEDRGDNAQNRQNNAQANQSTRQATSQSNQASRQSTSQANQASRQSTSQANQSTRQTTASSGSAGTGQAAQSNQANRQSTAQSSQSARQSTAQSSQSSRQSASYQSGGSARAQSARGQSSRSAASRGGGGRRR
jgi:hypothetical protein